MKGIRDIKRRIKAVKNTAQITRAMELVAASKMKRSQQQAIAGRAYSFLLAEIVESIMAQPIEDFKHPLLEPREVKVRGMLLVSTDKGLCGGLNTNLFRRLPTKQENVKYVTIGRKATNAIARSGRNLDANFQVSDHVNYSEVRVIVEYMVKEYVEGRIDTIEILFTRFQNTLTQVPLHRSLLPLISIQKELEELRARLGIAEKEVPHDKRQMLFEPDAKSVLQEIPTLFLKQSIYQMVLEAKASEHSARMVAMKSATDNAHSLADGLTLEYNKARQAAITQEILEIAAAAAR
jgi:F-type H+-transporting ATPase subunit gamma